MALQRPHIGPVRVRGGVAGRPPRAPSFNRSGEIGLIHRLILGAVWITFAMSGVVFSEPAPVDVLMMGLIVLLPSAGLLASSPRLVVYLSLWGLAAAAGLLASTMSEDLRASTVFTLVTIYLYVASFTIAAFVAHTPERHTRLILSAWLVAGLVSAAAGLAGYFSIFPGAFDLFTRFGRATGTFKDPNVMGAFLVAPFLFALHLILHSRAGSPWWRNGLAMLAAGVLALAVLLSFSRGAWLNLAAGVFIYATLAYLTAATVREREQIAIAVIGGVAIVALVTMAVMQDDGIASVLADRAQFTQSYDVGPAGRFGGQQKAFDLLLQHPFGIGAGQFVQHHHHEDVHNVYLSVFLNTGWLGGFTFAAMVVVTIGVGVISLAGGSATRPYTLVALSAFAATAAEGVVIDIDHWRSFYFLMALIWGLAAEPACKRVQG